MDERCFDSSGYKVFILCLSYRKRRTIKRDANQVGKMRIRVLRSIYFLRLRDTLARTKH
jgi:hypothetical protein